MLLAINEKAKGWLGIFVVCLIAIPFALWGIQEYIGGVDERIAGTVDGVEFTTSAVDRGVTQLRQNLQGQQNIPSDEELKRRALDQLINTTVIELHTKEQGYRISDNLLGSSVKAAFTRDGQFDRDYFDAVLQSQGLTPQTFEHQFRNDLRIQQQRSGFMDSAIVANADVRRIMKLERQTRDISWLKLNIDRLGKAIDVTEADIEEYYKTRQSRFMQPQQASIEYIELKSDSLPAAEIKEEELEILYDDYVQREKSREERKARHILVTIEDDADAARAKIAELEQQLKDGADFAALAKAHSQDPGSAEEGGDLDWVESGQMVKPFEDALFDLEKGQTSEIVETEFGFHLIKLDDVRGVEIASFDEKRAELVETLQKESAENSMYELSEIIATTAYENPDSLDPVAEAVGLQIASTELFTAGRGTGIASHSVVRQAAFADAVLRQGENSELIEIEPGHVMVLRVKDHVESTPLPLETVSSMISESIKISRGQEELNRVADEVIASLENGASINDVVRDGISDQGSLTVNMRSNDLDRRLLSQIMVMKPPVEGAPSYGSFSMGSGDVAVVILESVNLPEKIDDALYVQTRAQFRQARAVEDFSAVLDSIKAGAEIFVNEKALEDE